MLHSYHTHTFRNHHTVGMEREYIESAIKNGFQTLGFSEACRHIGSRMAMFAYFHMFPEDLNDYIQTLLTLKAGIRRPHRDSDWLRGGVLSPLL